MTERKIFPELLVAYLEIFDRFWWLLDGTLPHRRRTVQEYLLATAQQIIIGVGYDIEWPLRSPDLTHCFFVWGHLRVRVFTEQSTDLDHLRIRLTTEMDVLNTNPVLIK